MRGKYNPILTAYNLPFDLNKCQNTGIDLTMFSQRFDLWTASFNKWALTNKYKTFALENHAFNNRTALGNMTYQTNAEIMANPISVKGKGGNSTTAEGQLNYGAGFLFSDVEATSGNFVVNAEGGDGGYDNTGVGILASNVTALNGIIDIDGIGGDGKIVRENNGVGIWSTQANNLNDYSNYSIVNLNLFDTYIDSNQNTWYGNKIEAASIDIQGVGGKPTDKNQSLKNFGISMDDTKLISSGTMNLSGQGGDGGQSLSLIHI